MIQTTNHPSRSPVRAEMRLGNAPAHQIGCQRRQTIELILRPAVFDRCGLTLGVTGFFEALAEPAQTIDNVLGNRGSRNPITGIALSDRVYPERLPLRMTWKEALP